ncbi:MAG: glucose-6-phosphate dehydrogenase [Actinobacteria bacterium]|nr:glucose-6-phosphate dehydrogenase [Actinomycetota bacterium]
MSSNALLDPRPAMPPTSELGSATLVVFGATGDLARRKLFPALYNLAADGRLPRDFRLVGCAREELADNAFRERVAEWVARHSRRPPEPVALSGLLARIHFLAGSVADERFHAALGARLTRLDELFGGRGDRLFYLSIAPDLFAPTIERLGPLAETAAVGEARILIEKPFGRSAAEAEAFHRTVLAGFAESQVFRVDHYLGKEEVQNILALRFANSMIEPFWNAGSIASVEITAAENVGVGSRASYYEGVGALRDHLQNHMLQLLCMIAMGPPADLSAGALRDQKVAVLEAIRPPRPDEVAWGQYGPGEVEGRGVPGYLEEEGVAPDSRTETYVAVRLAVGTERWAGVPFYLRTGKRLARKETEIAVTMRPSPQQAFLGAGAGAPANQIVIGLRPHGGVRLTLATKRPGAGMELAPATMVVAGDDPVGGGGDAYERLLLDAMRGDATLFARSDEIEAQWRICDPVLGYLVERDARPAVYAAGSQGPEAARRILAAGHSWRLI